MFPIWLVLLPMFTAILLLFTRKRHMLEWIHALGSVLTTVYGLWMVKEIALTEHPLRLAPWFHVDGLSAVLIFIVSLVGVTTALHSIGYVRIEEQAEEMNARQVRQYYIGFHLFVASMLSITIVNNVGLMWVGIEATTIVSAFLVAITRNGASLEAAWKYLVICSVGIAFALLGITLLYSSSIHVLGTTGRALDWTILAEPTLHLNPEMMSLSFALLVIGFGTKIGLAPMHFWLPDAHSEAPAPISALLSGALLNCAVLVLIRFVIIANHTLHTHLVSHLLLTFGLLSVVIALPFILVQQDFKRMLAFSSVEHMGIIAIALGLGGTAGFTAATLQMVNHAMGKSLLFLSAGNISQRYHTKRIDLVRGVLTTLPVTGGLFLIASLAIAGIPPFSIFSSEFLLFAAGFQTGHPIIVSILIALIALIFAAMMYHVIRMTFGFADEGHRGERQKQWSVMPLFLPFIFVVGMGVYQPSIVKIVIAQAVQVMTGVSHL